MPSMLSLAAWPSGLEVNMVTWLPQATQRLACSCMFISAPPASGWRMSLQLNTSIFKAYPHGCLTSAPVESLVVQIILHGGSGAAEPHSLDPVLRAGPLNPHSYRVPH